MMMIFLFLLGVLFTGGSLKKSGFWFSTGVLGLVIFLGLLFDLGGEEQLVLSSSLGLDIFSYSLGVLSVWISLLMYGSSRGVYKGVDNLVFFYMSINFLLVFLLFTFSCLNLIYFYFFFEVSLLPTLFIILGWGYQPERLQAGLYFMFYTLAASLPLLLGLGGIYLNGGGLDYFLGVSVSGGLIFFLIYVLAFLVKMPMFFTHLWLPKAHVEAPVAGSMILAGILLKLGGYGFYRILPFCVLGLVGWGLYFFGLSIAGMLFVGLMCCRLNDLKALVAYSSVAHMGLVICGFTGFYLLGYLGALAMMLGHGLASSGLFCAVNMYYERFGSRSFFLNKGTLSVLPTFSLLFFLLCVANMAAPPTFNLASEIFLMGSMMKVDVLMVLMFPLGSYLGAVFTLFLFSYSQHGRSYFMSSSFGGGSFREYHLFVLHALPVNALILNMDYFLGV